MSKELWEAQKGYIDAAASSEAYGMGAKVTLLMAAVSFIFGLLVCSADSKIKKLEQRIEAIEKEESR